MPGKAEDYGIFVDDERWPAFLADLDGAKARALQIAIDDGVEAFVFSFKDSSEVARFFPRPRETHARKRSAVNLLACCRRPIRS